MNRISIIIPCYNEEEAIPVFYQAMKAVMSTMKYVGFELIFVDDGSQDQTLAVLRRLSASDPRCRYLSFSRNFGKEAAMYAGLSHASGDFAAVMDVDLQDPPSLLPQMYELLMTTDVDCVAARRTTRTGEKKIKSFLSDRFYDVINRVAKLDLKKGARDYRLMRRAMVDAVLEMSEYNRFSKGIFQWIGFRTEWIAYEHEERCAGESKWPLPKLLSYAIEGITGFSVAPLSFASIVGVVFCLISLVMTAVIVMRTLLFGDPVAGWPSLACILFLTSGVQLFGMGIIGVYLSKTYLETKRRPIYILKETDAVSAKCAIGYEKQCR